MRLAIDLFVVYALCASVMGNIYLNGEVEKREDMIETFIGGAKACRVFATEHEWGYMTEGSYERLCK